MKQALEYYGQGCYILYIEALLLHWSSFLQCILLTWLYLCWNEGYHSIKKSLHNVCGSDLFAVEESDIIDLEKRYWLLKAQSRTGRFDLETFVPLVSPPIHASLSEGNVIFMSVGFKRTLLDCYPDTLCIQYTPWHASICDSCSLKHFHFQEMSCFDNDDGFRRWDLHLHIAQYVLKVRQPEQSNYFLSSSEPWHFLPFCRLVSCLWWESGQSHWL